MHHAKRRLPPRGTATSATWRTSVVGRPPGRLRSQVERSGEQWWRASRGLARRNSRLFFLLFKFYLLVLDIEAQVVVDAHVLVGDERNQNDALASIIQTAKRSSDRRGSPGEPGSRPLETRPH